MSTSERDHRDEAILALAAADYRAAGDAYTHAAYGELAGLENHYREALARRLRFRRNRLPELLDGRLGAGRLHPPRGSTEYDADFQCPDCGASDVNYVADAVLCLRCASVIEKR
ncbi:hypothetical protein [Halapricum desulfuricans]|uniref:Zn finger domain containing protein n=1 Tax=Halapricum desulfuricans TaxID=2841257 RepID=A0A897N838_9EURY|nr:hypothetical protein [Halapricum desulfuricans]QSG08611.1 Zn finger domain containing protein [Halapricum desulfuricans]